MRSLCQIFVGGSFFGAAVSYILAHPLTVGQIALLGSAGLLLALKARHALTKA
jgi:hypothetical protein